MRRKVGVLKKEIIELLGLNLREQNIYFYENQMDHILKHENEFEDFNDVMKELNNIISNPDYVGLHANKNSVRYIKRLNEHTLVAVRLKNGNVNVRTIYPISEDKLKRYIALDKVKKV